MTTAELCPLCEERDADTFEDLITTWSRPKLAELGVYKDGQLPRVGMPLCGDCNYTFGRLYENAAAPIMKPMIVGEAQELSLSHQETIGRWVFKSAMLGALGTHPLTLDQRQWLRDVCLKLKVNQIPVDLSFVVRIGTRDFGQPMDAPGHAALHTDGPLPSMWLTGVESLGHVAWEVAVGPPSVVSEFVARTDDNDFFTRIWPPHIGSVSWPTMERLVVQDVYVLRAAWRYRIWPPPPDAKLPGIGEGSHRLGIIVKPPSQARPEPDHPTA